MNQPVQWAEIRRRFEEFYPLDPDARREGLAALRRDDPDLAREVGRLLHQTARSDGPFEEDLMGLVAEALRELVEEEDGNELPNQGRIGPFRLIEPIGRGGSGSVYHAVRADGAYETHVAIKVLRRGLDTTDLLDRFRAERQILASLSHLNIAALLDGGALPDGRPYLVMQYVDGERIDVYCDTHGLPVADRIELFLQVCDAVAYAHRNLVLHRDLKPSNILVRSSGDVCLLDFGIAKILDPERIPGKAARTRTGVRLFTPEYAAPEQVQGASADVATDIYQLGHLLYRLLTGRSPYDVPEEASVRELQRAVVEQSPLPPSKALESRGEARRRRLKGDLDAIALKALHKDPERRYPSVDQLSADLRRHLEGRAVEVRGDSAAYRLRRFAGRHPWPVATGALLGVGLMVGLGALGLHSSRLEAERSRAEMEAARAEATTGFLLDLFDLAGDSGAQDTITVGALLAQGRERLDERVGDHPLVQIEFLKSLEEAHRRMSLDQEALVLVERRAVVTRDFFGPDHPETMFAMHAAGLWRRNARHWPRAVELLEEVVDLAESLLPGELDPDTVSVVLSQAYRGLGTAYREMGRTGEALDAVQAAIAMGEVDPDAAPVEDRVRGAISLASALRGEGRLQEAADLYEEVLPLAREGAPDQMPALLNNHASLLREMDRLEEAEPLLREARERLWPGEEPPIMNFDVVGMNLRTLLEDLERYDEALQVARDLEELLRARLPPDHWRIARAVQSVGVVHLVAGECDLGEPILREAGELFEAAVGRENSFTARARTIHALCLIELDRFDEAEEVLLEARSVITGSESPSQGMIRTNLEGLVDLYGRTGRPAEAERYAGLLAELDVEGP